MYSFEEAVAADFLVCQVLQEVLPAIEDSMVVRDTNPPTTRKKKSE